MNYVTNKIKKINQHIRKYVDENASVFVVLIIYIDLLYSILRYGMNLDEYFQYGFFSKRHYEKKDFFVYRKRMLIVNKFNDNKYTQIFDDKPQFNDRFTSYVKRQWLNISNSTYEEFLNFIEECNEFIIKPSDGYYGLGIRKMSVNTEDNLEEIYQELLEEGALLEEIIVQLKDISEFNPSSVNTLRVVTMNSGKGEVDITTANFRMGNGLEKCADNFHHNGIASLIDVDLGIVKTIGIDKDLETYTVHPISGKKIVGYKVPYWEEVIATVKSAANVIPMVGYVGWDVAIGEHGDIIIIEGNPKADPDVSQLPDGIGKWSIYKKYLNK